MERCYRSRPTHESADRMVANVQPPGWGKTSQDQPQPTVYHDFTHVDLFSHEPQRTPVQMKLTVGAPGDQYEQEADRVAAQVVQQISAPPPNPSSGRSQSDPSVQRETLPDDDELQMKPMADQIQRVDMPEDEELQMKPIADQIQRVDIPEEDELQMKSMVQRQAGEEAVTASTNLESSIQQARSGGQPLADTIRQPMEQAFRADFSGVKVHTDTQSDQLNRSLQAKAFTTGQDVFFRQGAYEPGSRGGQELIAHELTHVVQQNGGAVQRSKLDHESPRQPGYVLQELRMGEERRPHAVGGRALPIKPTPTIGALTEKNAWVGASEAKPVVMRWPAKIQPRIPKKNEETGAQKEEAELQRELRVARKHRKDTATTAVGGWRNEGCVRGAGQVDVKVRMSPPSIQAFKFPYGGATIDTETADPTAWSDDVKIKVARSLRMWRESGIHPTSGQLLTLQDDREINAFIKKLSVKKPNRRAIFGYSNPHHDSAIGLNLLEAGAHTPYDPNVWATKEDWLLSPNRNFSTYSPNSRTQDSVFTQGHENVVFGHDMGASVHFNQTGHTQSPGTNRAWNHQIGIFHGLEQRDKSNASGAYAPQYQQPSQSLGSHPMYWDQNDPRYDPRFRRAFQ